MRLIEGVRAMKTGTWKEIVLPALAVLALFGATVSSAKAQLLYSFEPGLEGWANTGFTGGGASDLISVTQSTQGFTHGTHSMAVETGNAIPPDTSAFGWDVNESVSSGPIYDAYNVAAHDPTNYTLEFDITTTAESFAHVTSTGPFFLINVAVNSSNSGGAGGFDQVFNVTPNLIGTDTMGNWVPLPPNTYHVSIPFAELIGDPGLFVAPDATFYQLNIGSNKNNTLFQNGPGPRGAIYYVDNIQIVEKPETVEQTLFSWETPDNPSTPTVNEQYEGWVEGYHENAHVHSLVATGATHGNTALQIDRTPQPSGFYWGSQFLISSDTNPDPEVEEIDPVIQARIDQLMDDILNAQSVAFDLTYMYTDQFPNPAPEFTKFGLHFTDESGGQFQAEQSGFISIPTGTPETTVTIEIPLSAFTLYPTGELLLDEGFVEGSNFFRIGLSTNTNGAQIYQIDNFRLISLADAGLDGDFNEDGKVDAADYVMWRKTDSTMPNYDLWKQHFGESQAGSGGASGVPEPGTLLLLTTLVFVGSSIRRRDLQQ
jgi:hypothetical protein